MRLDALEFQSFRNLTQGALAFGPRFNLVWGENAQGKTNLLEALYLFGPLRSFRGDLAPRDAIRRGEPHARLHAKLHSAGYDGEVTLYWEGNERTLRADGKAMPETAAYFGRFAAVAYTPDDIELARGAKESRRAFMDRAIFQVQPGHVARTRAFDRAHRQRNQLLSAGLAADDTQLLAYTEEWARLAAGVALRRAAFARGLAPRFIEAARRISGARDELKLEYTCPGADPLPLPGPKPPPEEVRAAEKALTDTLIEAAHRTHAQALQWGYSAVGPHRDDLAITLNGEPLRRMGSQGQARTAVLALKIAEVELLRDRLGEYPVFLLDDLSSELDARRRAFLAEYLTHTGGQVFITSTEERLPGGFGASEVPRFHVVEGSVTGASPPAHFTSPPPG